MLPLRLFSQLHRAGLLLIVGCLGLLTLPAAEEATHPRLFMGPEDIPGLREKIEQEPWASMYQRLLTDAETDIHPFAAYNDAWRASSCAFLYLLTEDERWAVKARDYTQAVIDEDDWGHTLTFGLRMYMWNKHVAQAYDFCYASEAWDAEFCSTVSAALKQQSDVIHTHGGTGQNSNASSNWQGLRGAAAMLGYFATDESFDDTHLQEAITRTQDYLNANLGSEQSPGWNYEGLGYMTFPMATIGPAALAYERLGDNGDRFMGNESMATTWWTITGGTALYPSITIATAPEGIIGSHFDFADDNNHSIGEGCYGLSFAFLPEDLIPGQVWMYDRMRGAAGDQTWDNERAGIIYSILFHPGDAAVTNPLSIPEWRHLFQDHTGNGWNLFRNQYQNADDIVFGINLRLRTPGGHEGPDGLSFRLNGMGGPLAVGGGRYSDDNPYYRLQNTLYVENPGTTIPDNVNSRRQGVLRNTANTPLLNDDGSGALVGHMEATNLNVHHHTRRLLSDFSELSGAAATFVIADTSDDGHFWHYVAVDGINTITTDDNSFTVEGPNGSLRATVVYPPTVSFNQGTLERGSDFFYQGERFNTNRWINFTSADGDHLVVLTIVADGETHPEVTSLNGSSAHQRTIAIGDLAVQIDGEDIYRSTMPTAHRSILLNPILGVSIWESMGLDGTPMGAVNVDQDKRIAIDGFYSDQSILLAPIPANEG